MTLPDRFSLEGRIAVVTGASSGLGVRFALALAEAGADVALGARRVERLEDTRDRIESLGRRSIAVPTDVSRPEDCEHLVAAAREDLGDVHVLVNNAGVTEVANRDEQPAGFDRVLAVNLSGAYRVAQAFARACIDAGHGGSVVNISSVLGLVASSVPRPAYSASKAGLMAMTRALALQWAVPYGIRVNALVPGFFHTDMTAGIASNGAAMAGALDNIPMGRLGDADELVGALLLLTSHAGSYINGTSLIVDGGWTAR